MTDLRDLLATLLMAVATVTVIMATGSDVEPLVPCAHNGRVHYVRMGELE